MNYRPICLLNTQYKIFSSIITERLTVYVDLRKAYDSVEHWAIRRSLQFFGFDEKSTKLITNMNKGGKLDTQTPFGVSRTFDVKVGVRQGDPLSPILFILFINTLQTGTR